MTSKSRAGSSMKDELIGGFRKRIQKEINQYAFMMIFWYVLETKRQMNSAWMKSRIKQK